jgi:aspartyl-tRNA(Asn)/glutamyl-tRNA(Gln) amidotransferase subunit C
MSSITKDQLAHLAKLTSLKFSDAELETMLPQMENIINFVWQLQEVELEKLETCEGESELQVREWVGTPMDRKDFLANMKHPITDNMLTIETSTNQ